MSTAVPQQPHLPRASARLVGVELPGGWKLRSAIQPGPLATGGTFSTCYTATASDGKTVFVKALDYSDAFAPGVNTPRVLQALTTAYNYERDLVMQCRRMDRVVQGLAAGQVSVAPGPEGAVEYIVFEMGERDIRDQLASVKSLDVAWKLRSLHHIATGLWQLHSSKIAHRDLKPSNVVVFTDTISKVADLGRAAAQGNPSPYDALQVAGDKAYAPLELRYGEASLDWTRRHQACDVYLLGSMATFVFTGAAMTPLVIGGLHPDHRPDRWHGTYREILPYVRVCFDGVITAIEGQMPSFEGRDGFVQVVRELCEPDPELRGDLRNRLIGANQYRLDRYLTRFDLLAGRLEHARH